MSGRRPSSASSSRFPIALAFLVALLAPTAVKGQPAAASLYERTYVSPADGVLRIYEIRTPAGYDGVSRLPAALFLHGRGGDRRSFQGDGYLAEADARGFAMIFWQGRFDPTIGAYSTQYIDGANGIPDETDILACLDDALTSFPLDPDRVHLVGFSQGGKGALLVGLKNADRFASIVDGSGPSDAFEGQRWSPTFPDFRAAAGGDFAGAPGPVLALWFAQSARFYLGNARNVPLYLAHGTADSVVPDSLFLFPYRNTHHIADTPGFTDARGAVATLSERRAADPAGYAYVTSYPPGVDHVEDVVLAPAPIFAFMKSQVRVHRPVRVVATTYDARARSAYWTRLGRGTPPDGTPAGLDATVDAVANALSMRIFGNPAVDVRAADAGLDVSGPLTLRVDGGAALLHLEGAFPAHIRVLRDGILQIEGGIYSRIGTDIVLSPPEGFHGEELRIEAGTAELLIDSDLLVPALVDAPGLGGASFSTELTLANLSGGDLTVEALLLDGSEATTQLRLSRLQALSYASRTLLAIFGKAPGGSLASPLRLRIVAGSPGTLVASARVFNTVAGGGTYGLSFPVLSAGDSVLGAGEKADVLGTAPAHPSRVNVSVFAPFEDVSVVVETFDPEGMLSASRMLSLPKGSRTQLNDVLSGVAEPGRVTLTVQTGRAQIYGTAISNASTNDPFLCPALARGAASAVWTIPAVAAASGREGAVFSSDVFLGVPPGAPVSPVAIDLTYRPRDGSASATARISVPPGATRVLEDVLRSVFPGAVPGAGALEVRSAWPIQVLDVTRSDSASGPASQDVASIRGGDETTHESPTAFVGVAEFTEARSNLVLVNEGLATAVDLRLITEGGRLGADVTIPLAAGEIRQLDSFVRLFTSDAGLAVASGTLLVLPEAGGRIVAAVARIDNRTNDPTGIAPVRVPAAFSAIAP